MSQSPKTTQLWDYGWIHHDEVELPAATSVGELIEHYCASPSFHLSFLPSDKDETGLHGPFLVEKIAPADFVPLAPPGIPSYVEEIKFADEGDDDAEAHAIIFQEMREALETCTGCFVLKFTEANTDRFHEWGFVFSVFREILVPDLERKCLQRFAIGYD